MKLEIGVRFGDMLGVRCMVMFMVKLRVTYRFRVGIDLNVEP